MDLLTMLCACTLTSYFCGKYGNDNNNHIFTLFFLISADANKAHINLFLSIRYHRSHDYHSAHPTMYPPIFLRAICLHCTYMIPTSIVIL